MAASRPVLLVMDYQHGIVERMSTPALLDAADRAVKGAREKNVPVMFVRVAFRPGYPEVSGNNP
ncbi:MAG: isochorismatase family protein, partial [Streptosporangiales bacterium]|nr:isochorismatase family protein [Streptosporangiales bacterium]